MAETAQPTPVLTLTEGAADQVRSMIAEQPENLGKSLRVYVEQGGCSGMQYGLVFDEERPNDVRLECHGVSVLIDPFSAGYLVGSRVDYDDSLTGGGFKVLNPKAKQSCGCGKSFQT
jgi:iron-sulfur cluster assembly protein/iron-sulfur cluster insertion protein